MSDHGSEGSHEEAHEESHGHKGHDEEKNENAEVPADSSEGKEEKEGNHEGKSAGKKSFDLSDFLMILAIAILGRVLLKTINQFNIPSVEPIIPIAVYAGMAYGPVVGAIVGLLAYPVSSLLIPEVAFGMDALWMAAGGAIAGAMGGFSKKMATNDLVFFTFIGTLLYEFAVNIQYQQLLFYPFSFTHIISNVLFAYIVGALAFKGK